MKLTMHEPIAPIGKGADNISNQIKKRYDAVRSGQTPEYQGFVENPSQ
jgi:1-acyl-sn-glycerol-3-phosphate acyltransferase